MRNMPFTLPGQARAAHIPPGYFEMAEGEVEVGDMVWLPAGWKPVHPKDGYVGVDIQACARVVRPLRKLKIQAPDRLARLHKPAGHPRKHAAIAAEVES